MGYSNKFMGSVLGFVKEMEKDLDRLKEKLEDEWEYVKELNSLLSKKDEEIGELQKENARLKAASLADREVLKETLELMKEVNDKTSLNVSVSEINVVTINSLKYNPKYEYDRTDNVIDNIEEEVIVKPIDKLDIELTNEEELKIPVYA